MSIRRPEVSTILALWLPLCTGVVVAEEWPGPRGVVIEEVREGSALEEAGLQPGDVVLAWELLPGSPAPPETAREAPFQGEIESIFDYEWLEVELAPRGTVKLVVEREGVERLFEVVMGEWGGQVRPRLSDRLLEVYLPGRNDFEAGKLEQGLERWSQLSELDQAESDGRLQSWIKMRIGETYARARSWEEALEAYLGALEEAGVPAAEVAIWRRIGAVNERRNEFEKAEASYRSALEIAEATWGRNLHAASLKQNLGVLAYFQGQLELASTHFEDALEIRDELAPDSLDLAKSLNSVGVMAWTRGQLEAASSYYQRALAIKEKHAPGSLEVANSLNNLGLLARDRGHFELAGGYLERAVTIKEKLAPGSLELANSLSNLALVVSGSGQEELAKDYHQRALAIREKLAPDSLDLASSLKQLGNMAVKRGELELAHASYQRSLEIIERLAPDSLDVAGILNNLGLVAYDRDQLELARSYLRQALEIVEKLTPDSLGKVPVLNSMGLVDYKLGRFETAAAHHQRALEIQEKQAPDSFSVAQSLNYLGEATRALGDNERAAELFQRSIDSLEAQISRLGSSHDAKASSFAQYREYYRDSIEALLRINRPDDAFATQESSRARSFLALLAERDLIFQDVPEELDRERRRLAFLYERTQGQIEALDPRVHADELDHLKSELRDVRRQYVDNTERIRRASPRFSALRYPEPLDLEGVRRALDPGTVMLSYSVGQEQTDLFVLTREGVLRVHTLTPGDEVLRDQLARFDRQVMSHGRADPYAKGRSGMAKWLFNELIEPASETIENGDRLLIVPDGPLYRLPFAALIRETANREAGEREGDSGSGWQYLVEWKPVHTVLSGTVYAELRKQRRPGSPLRGGEPPIALAAFGDPEYPEALAGGDDGGRGAVADVYVRDVTARHTVKSLPHTRTEVETIAGLFGSQPVRTYLGAEASEERAKSLGKDVRIVHFAAHGLLDNDSPLNSALALTIPEELSDDRENGLLQVWEIFERVRLDADLVVLSACQTATGKEQFGEGLIGLSRAFQYAGARSVLATLWNVPDRTTAELMSRFYRHLRSGKPKDEALRAAQLELAGGEVRNEKGDVASAPFYWAAFQIIGDWQ